LIQHEVKPAVSDPRCAPAEPGALLVAIN
jgi:hypothetical protein